jgi:hypothetical protein
MTTEETMYAANTSNHIQHRNLIFFKNVKSLLDFQPEGVTPFPNTFAMRTARSKERGKPRIDIDTFWTEKKKSNKKQFYVPLPKASQLEVVANQWGSYISYKVKDMEESENSEKQEFMDLIDSYKKIFTEATQIAELAFPLYTVKFWDFKYCSLVLTFPSKIQENELEGIVTQLNESKNCSKMITLKYFRIQQDEKKLTLLVSPIFEIHTEAILFDKPVRHLDKKRKVEEDEKTVEEKTL